jgi:leader peptidase (prepilin peptidase)/N-methyltransferase
MWGIIFFFIFGLVIGSFLNAVIYRLRSGESVARGRSKCFDCQHVLSWLDLIPIISFLSLRGRCRYCRAKISWQYPLVELATASLFSGIFYYFFYLAPVTDLTLWRLVLSLILMSFSLVMFVYDLRYYLVVESVVWMIIVIMLLANLFIFQISWLSLLGAGAVICLFFWLQIVLSNGRWLGSGDLLLGLLMGVTLGWPRAVVALILAYWLGALISLGLVVAQRKNFNSQIPFGPFLMLGLVIVWFFGDYLLKLIYG